MHLKPLVIICRSQIQGVKAADIPSAYVLLPWIHRVVEVDAEAVRRELRRLRVGLDKTDKFFQGIQRIHAHPCRLDLLVISLSLLRCRPHGFNMGPIVTGNICEEILYWNFLEIVLFTIVTNSGLPLRR